MFELTKLITALILPPFSILLLWLFSLLLLCINRKKSALLSGFFALILLYIFSLPYTAQKLSDSLSREDKPSLEDYKSAQAIVVLGGGLRDSQELSGPLTVPGIALERMRYAAYLQQETRLPILISGASPNGNSEAKIMAREFEVFFHTPVKWLEEQSRNTKENAAFSRRILAAEQIKHIILVTNQWHMQRAKMLFEREGFKVLPAAVGSGLTPPSYGLNYMHFIPQAGALAANMQLLKEWIGYFKEKL
ncbi:YdcF family protein [Mesocricetibacter intestinalis]|uniref:YdcF family protein n=1 Tax=Mesocricetibacter intestinalis TaxID=1521930 RepID=UPI00105DC9A5|nr:YdcF family protein [Mesocricetibacter intestinalis]